MDLTALCYLGFTVTLWLIFAWIILCTYRINGKAKGEEPKYRMMEED